MTRVEQLNKAVDDMRDARDQWLENPNDGQAPTEPLCQSIIRTHEVFQRSMCPVSHIEVNNAVAVLHREFVDWYYGSEDIPPPAFWTAFNAVLDKRKKIDDMSRIPDQIPPIKTLREQKSSDRQIAMYIYGFLSKDGKTYSPDGTRRAGPFLDGRENINYDLLEQEAATPGSVVPRNWINPQQEARLRAAGVYDTTPAAIMGDEEQPREDRVAKAIELAQTGGTLPQIANVCKFTEREVEQVLAENDIPLPAVGMVPSVTSADTINAAISDLVAQGKRDSDIVNILRKQGMECNLGRVKQVRSSSAFATK